MAQPQLAVRFMTVESNRELNRGVLIGALFIFVMTWGAYIVGALSNVYFFQEKGLLAIQASGGNADKIIPVFISSAMPEWFTYLFMLTLLSAAMSTLSAQFHVQGTAIGRDVYETLKRGGRSVLITRIGIIIAVILAVILAYILPGSIIAQGTALFFGLCAATFLSVYTCALFWKGITRAGAIAGMVSGATISILWLLLVYKKTATALGLAKLLFGGLLIKTMPWPFVDPILVAVPASMIITILVSLLTEKPDEDHLRECFKGIGGV